MSIIPTSLSSYRNRQDWDLDAVRKLKAMCKSGGEPAVQTVFDLIMGRLKDQHARVSCNTLYLDESLDFPPLCQAG